MENNKNVSVELSLLTNASKHGKVNLDSLTWLVDNHMVHQTFVLYDIPSWVIADTMRNALIKALDHAFFVSILSGGKCYVTLYYADHWENLPEEKLTLTFNGKQVSSEQENETIGIEAMDFPIYQADLKGIRLRSSIMAGVKILQKEQQVLTETMKKFKMTCSEETLAMLAHAVKPWTLCFEQTRHLKFTEAVDLLTEAFKTDKFRYFVQKDGMALVTFLNKEAFEKGKSSTCPKWFVRMPACTSIWGSRMMSCYTAACYLQRMQK